MTILQALKSEDVNVRVTNGYRWLVYNILDTFIVYERKYNAKKSTVLYCGKDEELAVKHLLGD